MNMIDKYARFVSKIIIHPVTWMCVFTCFVHLINAQTTYVREDTDHWFPMAVSHETQNTRTLVEISMQNSLLNCQLRRRTHHDSNADGASPTIMYIYCIHAEKTLCLSHVASASNENGLLASEMELGFVKADSTIVTSCHVISHINSPIRPVCSKLVTAAIQALIVLIYLTRKSIKQWVMLVDWGYNSTQIATLSGKHGKNQVDITYKHAFALHWCCRSVWAVIFVTSLPIWKKNHY